MHEPRSVFVVPVSVEQKPARQKLAKIVDKGERGINKRNRMLLICLLSLSTALGCGQVATLQPTAIPQPTATSQPTATPIPGWEKFEGGGVELWLPESYEGGNLDEDIDMIVERLRNLGPDFEQMAQMIEQNPSMYVYVIWAFDSKVGDSGFLTNVAVTTEGVPSAITMDTYLDAALKRLPAQFQVVERDIVPLEDYQAGRLVIEFTISGVVGKEVLYVVKDGNTMWTITCATGAEEFDQRLPVFEQIALSFAVQP